MAPGGIVVLVWRYSVTSSEIKRISSCCHGEATDLVVHYTSGLHLAAGLRREEDLGEGASSRQVSIFFFPILFLSMYRKKKNIRCIRYSGRERGSSHRAEVTGYVHSRKSRCDCDHLGRSLDLDIRHNFAAEGCTASVIFESKDLRCVQGRTHGYCCCGGG